MSFTRETVRMSGVLRGSGRTAECMVSALRVSLVGTRLFKDCQLSIDWVSKDLSDGEYKLSFDERDVDKRCRNGEIDRRCCNGDIDMRYCSGGWQKAGI